MDGWIDVLKKGRRREERKERKGGRIGVIRKGKV